MWLKWLHRAPLLALLAGGACARAGEETAVRVAPRSLRAAPQANFTQHQLDLIEQHCPLGRPKLDPSIGFGPTRFVIREGYVLEHSSRDKIAIWVCEGISPAQLSGSLARSNPFHPDTLLPLGERAELADYKGSGYDRGHMAPAGDQTTDEQLKRETFFLSNMAPQKGALNQQIWAALEAKARDWLVARGGGYVLTGSLFYDPDEDDPSKADGLISHKEIGPDKVAVPTHFYKIVVTKTPAGQWEAIAFVLENRGYPRPYDFSVLEKPVDWIEDHSGIDFMPDLDSQDEPSVEGATPPLWTP